MSIMRVFWLTCDMTTALSIKASIRQETSQGVCIFHKQQMENNETQGVVREVALLGKKVLVEPLLYIYTLRNQKAKIAHSRTITDKNRHKYSTVQINQSLNGKKKSSNRQGSNE